MLRRNLVLPLCFLGILVSATTEVVLLSSPAHASNCNGSCGNDTGICKGTSTPCPSTGTCGLASCGTTGKLFNNIAFAGTTNTPGVRTLTNPVCYSTYNCALGTPAPYNLCSSGVCSGSVNLADTCASCTLTNIVDFKPTNCRYQGPCTEG